MSPNLMTNGTRQVFGFTTTASHNATPTKCTTIIATSTVTTTTTSFVTHQPRHHDLLPSTNGVIHMTTAAIPVTHQQTELHTFNFINGLSPECGQTGYEQDSNKETSERSVSQAISTKSFHANRKISPPLNRPEHLRFS